MKCKSVYKHICENLDLDLDSERCREIKRHLDGCPECTAYLDSLKKTILLYKSQQGPSVPLSTHERLFKAIDVATLKSAPSRKRSTQRGPSSSR